ncbi:MAG TPA: DUF4129 domain-containing protein, partial [Acidimicrobiales bacterium]
MAPAPFVDPDEIRRITRQVLSRRELSRPGPSIVQRVEGVIGRAFERAFGAALGGHGSLLASLFLLCILAVLLLLVLRFATTLRRQSAFPEPHGGSLARPATDWDADAAAHERAERWRDAVRCRYRASVAALAALGLVEERDGRTAGEYRRSVDRDVAAVAGAFDRLTDLFELTWYGDRAAGPADATQAARLRAGVESSARRASRRATRHE